MIINRIAELTREHGHIHTTNRVLKYLPRSIPPKGVPIYYKYIARKNWKQSGDFEYRPNPLKIVQIDPGRIRYNSRDRFSYLKDMYRDIGSIEDGNWDQTNQKFGEKTIFDSDTPNTTIYKAMKAHFKHGVKWENTAFIQNVIKKSQSGERVWHGSESKQDILNRCERLDELYSNIKQNGYKSKKELLNSSDDNMGRTPRINPMRFYYAHDEVVCNIGRDGQFLFVGGHHRLSIAKILNINKIPIRVFVRHRQWQQKRDKLLSNHKDSAHPDI